MAPKYGIKSDTQVRVWVAAYRKFKIQGVCSLYQYSGQFVYLKAKNENKMK